MRIFFAGGGQCAEYIAHRLIREQHDLTLLEQDEQRCAYLQEKLDARVLRGCAASISDWRNAGLADADMFMACTDSDEINVLACMIANDLAPEAPKAIRLRTAEHAEWLETFNRLGLRIDRVVHPEVDMVNRILRVISFPGISDIRSFADGRVNLLSMNLELGHALVGMRVEDFSRLPGQDNAKIGVIFRGNDSIIPQADDRLAVGDHVYIICPAETRPGTLEQIGVNQQRKLRQVFITGGGEMGLELARELEKLKVAVKLFDSDSARCDYLATELKNTVVINADGTSQEVLLQEHIQGVDAFIALTGDQDANLIASLLARRLGIEKVIPSVNSINYLELAQRLGINTTVNPRIKSADALLEFVRKGGVLSVRTLGEEKVEALELEVHADSEFIKNSPEGLVLPQGCELGAIVHIDGNIEITQSSAPIGAGDHIILFSQEGAVRELEKTFLLTNA